MVVGDRRGYLYGSRGSLISSFAGGLNELWVKSVAVRRIIEAYG